MKKVFKSPIIYIALLVALDQLTKYLVRSRMFVGESIPVTPFFHLTYLTNTGVAFSMFQGANAVFAVLALAIIAFFGVWYARHRSAMPALVHSAFTLIFAGAIGNFIDRVLYGHVTDFLDFFVGTRHWPSFNVADSCVSVGGVILFISLLVSDSLGKSKEASR